MLASLRIATVVCLGVAALVVAPHAALADLPGGAKVVFSRLMIREDNKPDLIDGSVEQERKYFNRAHCYCSVEGAGAADFVETEFAWELRLSNRTQAVNVPAEIYSGADCDDDQNRMRCELLASIADLDVLTSRPSRALLRIHKVIEPLATQDKCGASERKALVWVGADGDSQGGPEYWASSGVDIDTNPPPTPRAVSAVPGENAITLRWSNPDERSSDVAYYQFLCAKRLSTDTVEPALKKPSHEPEFQSAADLCGLTAAGTQISFSAAEGSATAPAWLGDAELYVCGETVGASTSYRIPNLANDTPYQVAMVAVDLAGNAAGVFLTDDIKPVPVIDFWEDLHQRGGDAEGGFCLVASAYGDDGGITRGLRHFRDQTLSRTAAGRWLTRRYYEASSALAPALASAPGRAVAMVLLAPLVSLALLWHMLTLPGLLLLLGAAALLWRRTRGARRGRAWRPRARALASAAAVLLALGLVPSQARAQSVAPYWDDDLASDSTEDALRPRWHVGLRLGPYTPAIDSQCGDACRSNTPTGPYEAMFGGDAWMPAIDIDRVLWESFGQVTIGGSAGFMGKSARPYAAGSVAGADRERVSDQNRFRLVPLTLEAAFRLTVLDTRFGIPIVPYVRGGLAYYIWWVEAPGGGVATVCAGGASCNENQARGGSLGVVGSIGVAIRAERIDSEGAAAMREGGILHAGFYAELQGGRVDDFGIGNKLSVGDLTWFAGINFEF